MNWDDLILAVAERYPGWTWDYIDCNMTIPRVNAIFKRWGDCPPVHLSSALAAGVDLKGSPSQGGESATAEQEKQMGQFFAMFPKRNDG